MSLTTNLALLCLLAWLVAVVGEQSSQSKRINQDLAGKLMNNIRIFRGQQRQRAQLQLLNQRKNFDATELEHVRSLSSHQHRTTEEMATAVRNKLKTFVVDAFTAAPFTGNPAAVCLVEAGQELSDDVMQRIAAEMNLSETAFVRCLQDNDTCASGDRFGLRWFTPAVEVPLCGHATLAAAAVLFRCIGNSSPLLTFDTLSGPLMAAVDGDFISMDMPYNDPQKLEGADLSELSELIEAAVGNMEVADVQLSPTTRKLLVRLADSYSIQDLENLKPRTDLFISAHTGKVRGVIVTVKSSDEKYDFVSRYFAPWVGIHEDPVTGSAHTVLGPYWSRILSKSQLFARQCSARGGDLRVTVRSTDQRVDVAGQAAVVLQGTLTTD